MSDDSELKLKSGSTEPSRIKLRKREKRYLRACYRPGCFHPAWQTSVVDGRTVWTCKCHDPDEPGECTETKAARERQHFLKDGECVFCGEACSRNAIHGLGGSIIFVCERHYKTSLGEVRRFYRLSDVKKTA